VFVSKADKSVDDMDDGEVSSVTARGLVDMLERDNKSLVQRSRELEKQLHILRAAGSRMPPSEFVRCFVCALIDNLHILLSFPSVLCHCWLDIWPVKLLLQNPLG